jgi:hypothetical protein
LFPAGERFVDSDNIFEDSTTYMAIKTENMEANQQPNVGIPAG